MIWFSLFTVEKCVSDSSHVPDFILLGRNWQKIERFKRWLWEELKMNVQLTFYWIIEEEYNAFAKEAYQVSFL